MFAACTGFIYALNIADKFIKSEAAENILVIGAEVLSRVIDWSDRSTCILMGMVQELVFYQEALKGNNFYI